MTQASFMPETSQSVEADLVVSQACLRNQQPIADVLSAEIPDHSVVLEIGSGTGQHAAFIAPLLPTVSWQPSEVAERIPLINAWRAKAACDNFLPPLVLDVAQDLWPVKQVDAVFSSNVIHYISWPKVRSMLEGIGRVTRVGGLVFFYGPYNYNGRFTSEGNEKLDQWLKADIDPEAGIKDFDQILLAARREKLRLLKDIEMPANNRILMFRKFD